MIKTSSIYDFPRTELDAFLKSIGQPAFRIGQIWQGLYKNLWATSEEFSNLPKTLRTDLFEQRPLNPMQILKTISSHDGSTTKTSFKLPGDHAIETVLMRYEHRNSVCVSMQAGCAVGCVFCATGQMGFRRNLLSGEIVTQVLHFARMLMKVDEKINNVVFMGMGEPFLNMDAVVASIDILNSPDGFNLGARNFTISTVGIIPGILKMAQEQSQVNLSISLHAANNELRSRLVPLSQKYPLEKLIQACREYSKATHRRITFEWAMIDGVNDSLESAREFFHLVKGLLCHINLIPLNPTSGYSGRASRPERMHKFKAYLEDGGIPCTIRLGRGIDIKAGCGQLAVKDTR